MSEPKTLSDLEHDAINLQALLGALDLIAWKAGEASDGQELPADVRAANNAMPPLLDSIRERADALLNDIGTLAMTSKKERRA